VKHYAFHDVLISFVKFFFGQKHQANYHAREERILNLKSAGLDLTGWDKIKTESKEYRQMSWIDRQNFDELNSKDFIDVVRNIEEKGTRTTKVILRLDNM
jgi:hypothetical protein